MLNKVLKVECLRIVFDSLAWQCAIIHKHLPKIYIYMYQGDLVFSSDEVDNFAKEVKDFAEGKMAWGAIDPVAGDTKDTF